MVTLADTPAGLIARLDDSLSRRGETVTVTRGATTATVNAHVRTVSEKEVVGDVKSDWRVVILSPTGLSSLLPLARGDKIVVETDLTLNVELVKTIRLDDVLVRMNVMVSH
jgi:hypothetical protein